MKMRGEWIENSGLTDKDHWRKSEILAKFDRMTCDINRLESNSVLWTLLIITRFWE
ncbi:hypothetical protein GGE08_002013 [Muricauda sp. ARW1Y1]|nr:hypothetical protein [Muricauda sp. ARW1Y1]